MLCMLYFMIFMSRRANIIYIPLRMATIIIWVSFICMWYSFPAMGMTRFDCVYVYTTVHLSFISPK